MDSIATGSGEAFSFANRLENHADSAIQFVQEGHSRLGLGLPSIPMIFCNDAQAASEK